MKNNFIPFAKPMLSKKEKNAALNVLNGSILTHGPKCRNFEKEFGYFHHKYNAVTLSNCTSAMFLALKSLEIGIGDEVIVPAMTHIATAHCVSHTGAKVVFCDIDENTGNINCDIIKEKITKRTKAIIVVHFIGLPADMDLLLDVIKKKSIYVIEDCAAALGANINGKLVGTFSDAGCFSFYPTKHITTMEGGMLISKSKKLTNKIRSLSSFGYNKTLQERSIPGIYDVDLLGYNLRMTEVAASIGLEQLKKLPFFIKKRKKNAKIIKSIISERADLNVLPSKFKSSESSDFCVNVIIKNGKSNFRNALILKLNSNNIGTSVHYPICLPNSKYYSSIVFRAK